MRRFARRRRRRDRRFHWAIRTRRAMSEAVTTCDVLVIGAGPGGGNAALQSARLGLKTILIEDHEEIGTPVHCGECISDIACQNLGLSLPDEVISMKVKGIRVIFPDGTETVSYTHLTLPTIYSV